MNVLKPTKKSYMWGGSDTAPTTSSVVQTQRKCHDIVYYMWGADFSKYYVTLDLHITENEVEELSGDTFINTITTNAPSPDSYSSEGRYTLKYCWKIKSPRDSWWTKNDEWSNWSPETSKYYWIKMTATSVDGDGHANEISATSHYFTIGFHTQENYFEGSPWNGFGVGTPKQITIESLSLNPNHGVLQFSPGITCTDCFFNAKVSFTFLIEIQKCTFTAWSFWEGKFKPVSYPCGVGTTYGYVEGSADMAFNVQIGPDVQLSEPEFLTLLKDEQVGPAISWSPAFEIPGLSIQILKLNMGLDAYGKAGFSTSGVGFAKLGYNASADIKLGYQYKPDGTSGPIYSHSFTHNFQPLEVAHGNDLLVNGYVEVGLRPKLQFLLLRTIPLDIYLTPHVGVDIDAKMEGMLNTKQCPASADADAHYGMYVGVGWAASIGQIAIRYDCGNGATDWENIFTVSFWVCELGTPSSGNEVEFKLIDKDPLVRYPEYHDATLVPKTFIPKPECKWCSGCINFNGFVKGTLSILGDLCNATRYTTTFEKEMASYMGILVQDVTWLSCKLSNSRRSTAKTSSEIAFQVECGTSSADAITRNIRQATTHMGSVGGHPIVSSTTPQSGRAGGGASGTSSSTASGSGSHLFIICIVAGIAAGVVLVAGVAAFFVMRSHRNVQNTQEQEIEITAVPAAVYGDTKTSPECDAVASI